MATTHLQARIFTTATFYRHLKISLANFSDLRKANKRKNVSKKFSEKIMLAVTQVNGCRMCSYVHTKNAIDAGIPEDEINAMLNGELGDVNKNESIGLMFAQHYADTDGKPDKATYDNFVNYYGEEKAADILAMIRVIMAANIHGVALDALKNRLKGKKVEGSKFRHELGITLGIIVLVPVAAIQVGFEKLFKRK